MLCLLQIVTTDTLYGRSAYFTFIENLRFILTHIVSFFQSIYIFNKTFFIHYTQILQPYSSIDELLSWVETLITLRSLQ